jgi:hypothetical protein
MPRKSKTQKKRRIHKRRGGCSDCSSKSFLMNGGGDLNTPSFEKLSSDHYYPLNDYKHDPTYVTLSTRTMNGGRRNRKSKKIKRRRSMKGGATDLLQGSAFNVVNAHGTTSGSTILTNALTGNMNMQNPSNLDQPALLKYSDLNPPLA